jgi:hypothetical protein
MTEPATCEPQPELREVEWHWLRRHATPPQPVQWGDAYWWNLPGWCDEVTPAEAYEDGWRYVGPARPPKEGE